MWLAFALCALCCTLASMPLGSATDNTVLAYMARARAAGSVWIPLGLPEEGGADKLGKASSDSDMMRLVECINNQYVPKNMTWAAAMADEVASMKVIGAWWTTKQAHVPLTVATQMSVDRIPQLHAQCKSWQGPHSVVLYQALFQETLEKLTPENEEILRRALLQVSDFFMQTEQDPHACKPDILLVYEIYTEERATLLYPMNLLRNLARLQARTPMVALLDVDMLVSDSLYSSLLLRPVQDAMVKNTQSKSVYVLPAFETHLHADYGRSEQAAALADKLIVQNKDSFVKAIQEGLANPFDSNKYPQGHNYTNVAKWFETQADYTITPGEGYEPWVVADRRIVPWYDVRYRAFGFNKVQHIADIRASGFNFIVHHSAFIIHRAHVRSSSYQKWHADVIDRKHKRDRNNLYGYTLALYTKAKKLLSAGKFKPVLDLATTKCQATLPWWRPAD